MMLDWNEYRKLIATKNVELGRLSPGTIRGYRELTNAAAATNHLGPKVRELIALAVAVTRQCDGCITVHADLAKKHGATKDEVAEALGVAIAVNAGAALVFSGRVLDAYNQQSPVAQPSAADGPNPERPASRPEK